MDSNFEHYAIIQHLRRNHPSFYAAVEQLYTTCQGLLAEIPDTFPNYTIHDIGHSVRVIGYMDDLVKDRVERFSPLHLMLIVCVGLLHDTGMIVTDDEKEALYREFETRDPAFKNLTEEKKKLHLQNYVRKRHGERVAAVLERPINDSAKIKSLLYAGDTKSYDLSELVAAICRSHNEDCAWIEQNLDQECHYGSDEFNPRQIALLLRIGDALDIDDRRAPYFLYKLLNPKGVSDTEWRKHIPITNYDKIRQEDGAYLITFTGECDDPEIFRKLQDYVDWLRGDLKEAAALWADFKDVYRLNVSGAVEMHIKTKGFTAAHLAFHLEYRQISKLLMGERIYGSKQDGLRELLQNAIDAVLLMDGIEKKNPYSNYTPMIGVEIDEKARQLVVFDNGTGMSQHILQNYFFNIGNSYYVSDEFKSGQYRYQPIGHFGIGFLACFMLSSKIRLETKHYQEQETILMDFDRDSSYVTQLDGSPRYPLDHGTRIILDYDQIVPAVFPDSRSIYTYLQKLLAAGGYKMLFIHNGEAETLPLPALQECELGNGEKFSFSYDFGTHLNVQFDPVDFLRSFEFLYIVDDTFVDDDDDFLPYYGTFTYYEQSVIDLEREYLSEESTWLDILPQIPDFFYDWLRAAVPDLENEEYGRDLSTFFELYIASFIQNSTLSWYEVPVLCHRDTFNNFLDTVESEGLETALIRYKRDIHMVSMLSRGPMSDATVLAVIASHLSLFAEDFWSTDVSYFDKYPIPPVKDSIQLLRLPGSDDYLRVLTDIPVLSSKVYLKGIHIKNESITLPYTIADIELKQLSIDVRSGDYDTNVARSSLDEPSRAKLAGKAARLVYSDIMRHFNLSPTEKALIRQFLDTYYC